jgi:hypothetical protein
MTTAICTLFEKDYHHGVAALVNSLVRGGFTGQIYAGYRGPLPQWARTARRATVGAWNDAHILDVTPDCALVFLPMHTTAHFTNIKPDFMLQLLAQDSLHIEHLLYLDPDICVVAKWSFIADWLTCGVALCEDVNSPLGRHHPRRIGWRRHFGRAGISLEFRDSEYVNGGCVGVSRADARFLEGWQILSRDMAEVIGGLGTAKIEGGGQFRESGFASCFDCSDQDALNAAMEMNASLTYSILPRAAMTFTPGAAVMPHALGPRKPWRRRYLREALGAVPPTAADKAFWAQANGPLRSMDAARIRRTRRSLALASAIGRFWRRPG